VDSYLDGLYNNHEDHNDGMQAYGPGGDAYVTHNYLDVAPRTASG
jgi:hypothetical protein